jgi:ankyrin repeat protein
LRALVDGGADVNQADEFGWTPLMRAALNGRLETVKGLVDAHADLNVKATNGRTALVMARGQDDIIEFLKTAGATE